MVRAPSATARGDRQEWSVRQAVTFAPHTSVYRYICLELSLGRKTCLLFGVVATNDASYSIILRTRVFTRSGGQQLRCELRSPDTPQPEPQ